ncbi:(2Fe-2S)-binding protein [Phycicoccus sp. BSK3Z-2]|uniref:Bacterioferritin-associated ferredoxin n=1 Tax=Phycicoccus avicenniae TaxID=2828860 RepID=A0A941HZR7_9MICO|nr:(2Fe-2S)-binding protein [Phycicoccus avicenniae]MBR7742536.1 (2Fe-2S)-binding protein [Phycicoccus avicenniae]
MIICHCKVVNDRAITDAVDAGATSLAAVCRETGAGTDCGGCVFAVKAIVCDHDVVRARTMDDLRAISIDEESIRAAS